MLNNEKTALEAKLRAECEVGYAIGPGAVGPYSVTGETFVELQEMAVFKTPQAAYDAAVSAFKAYAADKSGTLYWRAPPELGEKNGKFAFYMRLLISDMPVIKKAAAS